MYEQKSSHGAVPDILRRKKLQLTPVANVIVFSFSSCSTYILFPGHRAAPVSFKNEEPHLIKTLNNPEKKRPRRVFEDFEPFGDLIFLSIVYMIFRDLNNKKVTPSL